MIRFNSKHLVKFYGEIGAGRLSRGPDAKFKVRAFEKPFLEAFSSFGGYDFCHFFDPLVHDFGTEENPNIWCLFEFMGQDVRAGYIQTAIGASKLSPLDSIDAVSDHSDQAIRRIPEFDTVLIHGGSKSPSKSLPVSYPQTFEYQGETFLAIENFWSGRGMSLYRMEFRGGRPSVEHLGDIRTKAVDCNILLTESGLMYWGTNSKYQVLAGRFDIREKRIVPLGENKIHGAYSPRFARNAGPLIISGGVWRPFQDCSRVYGERFGLAEFIYDPKDPEGSLFHHFAELAKMQESKFEELFVHVDGPEWTRWKKHHISTLAGSGSNYEASSMAGICFIDGGRYMVLDSHGSVAYSRSEYLN